MREVRPHLWIGHAGDARDIRRLLDQGIEVLIDLALEEPPVAVPREMIYCRFPLRDGAGNSPILLQIAVETTAALMRAKVPMLIACSGGMSRSPAIAAAALARVEGWDLQSALERVTATGPCDLSPRLWAEIMDICRGHC